MKLEIDIHHHFTGDDEQRPQPADPRLFEMMERIMSQLDDLQTDSTAIIGDLELIKAHLTSQADKITALTAQLEQLQQSVPPQVDLSSVVAAANDIRSEADAIVASFTPAAEPAPVDGSAGDGSAPAGDTSSSSGTTDTSGSGTADAGGTVDAGAGATDGSTGTADAGGGDVSGTQADQQPV